MPYLINIYSAYEAGNRESISEAMESINVVLEGISVKWL